MICYEMVDIKEFVTSGVTVCNKKDRFAFKVVKLTNLFFWGK